MSTEDDQFVALGPDVGSEAAFLTRGANIDIGGHFEGKIAGVEAVCNNGVAVSATAVNSNDGAVVVFNNGGGPGFFCPGLNVGSGHGEGVFAVGATNGVHGITNSGDGVLGEGKNGVHGLSRSPTDSGVYGENTGGGTGVGGLTNGESGPKGTVAGVWGVNQGAGAGVRGTGGKTGVLGECNGRLGSNGVHGFGAAEGSGVRGTGGVYGVIGEGPIGVRGESSVQGVFSESIGVLAESTVGGTGLRANASGGTGVSASGGIGGVFEGTIAPLQLVPSQIAGKPATGQHSMGELYVDVHGVLYFCIASGTPGNWRIVQLV